MAAIPPNDEHVRRARFLKSGDVTTVGGQVSAPLDQAAFWMPFTANRQFKKAFQMGHPGDTIALSPPLIVEQSHIDHADYFSC